MRGDFLVYYDSENASKETLKEDYVEGSALGICVDVPRIETPAEEGSEAGVDFSSILQQDTPKNFSLLCSVP